MEELKSGLKVIESLMWRIAFVREHLEAWQQPLKREDEGYTLELHGVAIRTHSQFAFYLFDTNDRDTGEIIKHDRPELNAATLAARDLIIQALQTELARLEAELSTYQITKSK